MIHVVLLSAALASAGAGERLLITEVRGADTARDAELGAALQRALVAEADALGLDVLSAEELTRMVDLEVQKQIAGCDDDGCLAEIAEGLGAERSLSASLARVGGEHILSLSLLDPGRGRVVARDQARAGDEEALLDETRAAARRLLAPMAAVREPPPLPSPRPVEADPVLLASGGTLIALGVVAAGFGVAPLVAVNSATADAEAAAADYQAGVSGALDRLSEANLAHREAAAQWNGLGLALTAGGAAAALAGAALLGFAFTE